MRSGVVRNGVTGVAVRQARSGESTTCTPGGTSDIGVAVT